MAISGDSSRGDSNPGSVCMVGLYRLRVKMVLDKRDRELDEILPELRKRLKVAIQMDSRRQALFDRELHKNVPELRPVPHDAGQPQCRPRHVPLNPVRSALPDVIGVPSGSWKKRLQRRGIAIEANGDYVRQDP